jgi:hypothetical protein
MSCVCRVSVDADQQFLLLFLEAYLFSQVHLALPCAHVPVERLMREIEDE